MQRCGCPRSSVIRVVAKRLENDRRFEAGFLAVEDVGGPIDEADIVIILTIAEQP